MPLSTPGRSVVVDADDYAFVSRFKWWSVNGLYAVTRIDGHQVLMHRLIMGAQPSDMVDHRNQDTSDNRKSNLRYCIHRLNLANRGKPKNNTSGFKGVGYRRDNGRWRAQIKVDGRKRHLGYFGTREEAAKAYDVGALLHFGEFACLNFPDEVAT